MKMLRTAWSIPINPKSPAARLNLMICFIPVIPTFGLGWVIPIRNGN